MAMSKMLLIIQTKIPICYLLLNFESNFWMVSPKSEAKLVIRFDPFMSFTLNFNQVYFES